MVPKKVTMTLLKGNTNFPEKVISFEKVMGRLKKWKERGPPTRSLDCYLDNT